MDIVVRGAAIALTGAVLTLLLKRTNPEFSLMLSMAICAVVLTAALTAYSAIAGTLEAVSLSTGFSAAYIAPIFKCVGIGITAKFGSSLCADAGQTALSSAVEICGAVCAIYVCLPLIKTLLRIIEELA
ncbi:MAG: stage III sporulation AC/AD family protein [Oscillospiraceae bacterium]|jgi:stage III sporulation protein AD|nr:stage III sporulation AC/AD family protein [Oscillospiraceae bacterium]